MMNKTPQQKVNPYAGPDVMASAIESGFFNPNGNRPQSPSADVLANLPKSPREDQPVEIKEFQAPKKSPSSKKKP